MLKLNKLEKQTILPAAEVYDVCAQLCSVAVQFEDTWERKDIEFDADLEDAAYTQADPGLLELVWTNLLSNAVKFTPQGGSITLRQTRANGKLYVSVTDTGCGMDEKTIKHIYDKFYQGDTSHSTEGNGLGMALVKRILELTGVEMQIESTPRQRLDLYGRAGREKISKTDIVQADTPRNVGLFLIFFRIKAIPHNSKCRYRYKNFFTILRLKYLLSILILLYDI